ncbi:amino acid permease-domain-containing protein [Aspergillus pseudotamarii]|uniref:Amino acid permease-domain-containing protein n=1 Tax=Aspergillus pseudotamarii TaxID=132259 RepID=A0A5N6T246_ASPPS|nr:amino acid permease-domain-containing protein [Aspergillus pseudotamarii]KAE8140358.1 amino acid permease-domain-containing protein [Aspergillus pseudotamarii]
MENNNKDGEEMGTRFDQTDMTRMGKIQELKGRFILDVHVDLCWIRADYSNNVRNGLNASETLNLLDISIGSPTSGGQYHWVSELASSHYQRVLSYITGWMSVLAWQAGAASGSFLTGTIIQGLISVKDSTSWMPRIQNLLLALHILCFVIVITVLWAMAPQQPAHALFLEFSNTGGWSSMGLALMVGQTSAIYAGLSSDATAHMAEEVRDAGRYVPIAIIWGFFTNGAMAIVLVITYLFAMPSLEDALDDPTGFPFIYVFKNAVGTAGVNDLTAIILIPVIFSNILFNASTARQTYAFARDKGLPFAKWICKVNPKQKLPVNAIGLSCVISGLLALINIGSDTAFHAIITLNVAALMWTYVVSVGCLLYRRLSCPETLPPQRWSMGKYGIWVNAAALVYVVFAFFSLWPTSTPVTLTTFNWSVVIFLTVFFISGVMYIIKGQKEYAEPVISVRRDAMPQALVNRHGIRREI